MVRISCQRRGVGIVPMMIGWRFLSVFPLLLGAVVQVLVVDHLVALDEAVRVLGLIYFVISLAS